MRTRERYRRCASRSWDSDRGVTAQSNIAFLWRPEVQSLPAYQAGASIDSVRAKYGLEHVTKLASNENPFGASPQAVRALHSSLGQLGRYPDPACTMLRGAIEQLTGICANRIIVGNGSEALIEMICLAVLSAGDRVVTMTPCFGLHEIFPSMMGAIVDKVPVSDLLEFDLPAWRAALGRRAKLVLFGNPSNPVGCCLSAAQLQTLIDCTPADALIVVDEAYYEYAVGAGYADSIDILSAQNRPWMVLRTLSKAYGLAGLRVGYALTSDSALVAALGKVGTPFSVNSVAQVAGLAALRDTAHLKAVVEATRLERTRLETDIAALNHQHRWGLRVAPSRANFLFIETGRSSARLADQLMRRGVIIKPWLETGFDTSIRVTVGTAVENRHFLDALVDVLESTRSDVKAESQVLL